jgi:spermidine synthase
MTIVLDHRPDASLAVYIDGDLQFDSRDEALYHELLALPALALATSRRPGSHKLRALICGGGDGLVARELLKSAAIAHIDLVDYDPTILDLAREEWPELNSHALADPRLKVHVVDALAFVDQTARGHREYDLIISDFTVPRDVAGARLHTVEWYAALHAILAPLGVLAVNAASPSQTPAAYWSIYNSLRAAKLNPRPYRIALPSFADVGYGDDWGFILAAPRLLRIREFDALEFAGPRRFLRNAAQLRRCFAFPSALAAGRAAAPPTSLGSEWLLQALFNPTWEEASGRDWNALSWNHDPAPLPAINRGELLLPYTVQATLRDSAATDEEAIFNQVVATMPALRADQTRSMIHEFIAQPGRFLAALDLRALVDALLRRAAELPRRLVAELRLLRANLRRSWSNPSALLQRGLRIVSIIAIVIILANLLHPDTAYGKGSTGADDSPGTSQTFARSTTPYDVVPAPPSTVSGRGFSSSTYGRGSVVDEYGTYTPTRRYYYRRNYYYGNGYRSYNSSRPPTEDPNEGEALYRLTPETDLLANGEVVIALTDQSYLLLADQVTSVVDIKTGLPIIFLKRDPSLVWRTAQELNRQRTGLQGSVKAKQDWIDWMSWVGFAPWRDDDEAELGNIQSTVGVLDKAIASLGDIPATPPALPVAPVSGAFQLFSSVWMDTAGRQMVLELPDNKLAYLTKDGWWSDSAHTQPMSEPYPSQLRDLVLVPFLTKQKDEAAAIKTRLEADLTSARTDLSSLQSDKTEYTSIQSSYGPSDEVEYGTSEIRVDEALRLTDADIQRTQQLITALEAQLAELPRQNEAAITLLGLLK